jgi:hypothetical protein
MFENLKEPDNIIETKLIKRLKFFSADKGDFEDYKNSIMTEECNLNKKRREELFLNKRKLSFPKAVNFNEQLVTPKDKVDNVSNNVDPFEEIPAFSNKDMVEIKNMLSQGLVEEEIYDKVRVKVNTYYTVVEPYHPHGTKFQEHKMANQQPMS